MGKRKRAWQLVEDQAFASLKRTGLLPKGSGHEARATEDLIKWSLLSTARTILAVEASEKR